MTQSLSIVLGLGTSLTAQQLTRTLENHVSFEVLATVTRGDALLTALEGRNTPPDMVVLSNELGGPDVTWLVSELVRERGLRVFVLALPSCDEADFATRMLNAGAVHVEQARVNRLGDLSDAGQQRLIHRLQLFSEIRTLSPKRRKERSGLLNINSPSSNSPSGKVTRRPSRLSTPPPEPIGDDVWERLGTPARTPQPTSAPSTQRTREPSFGQGLHALKRPREGVALIGIVSSTGGLTALETVLSSLPQEFPVPVAIVQHIGKGFDRDFARALQRNSRMHIRVVDQAIKPRPGIAYISPSEAHLVVTEGPRLELRQEPRDVPYRPSGDIFFNTLAEALGPRAIGVILTGMGADGAAGMTKLFQCGGHTIAQDSETSLVFGMPQAAIAAGAATQVLAINDIARALIELTRP